MTTGSANLTQSAGTPKAKKQSKQERIEHLTNLLNLRCSELEDLIGREKEIYRVLGGIGGEHPLERSKRVVAARSALADKVLSKDSSLKAVELMNRQLRDDVSKLQGKLEAIQAITETR
jgi:hypothetical protein